MAQWYTQRKDILQMEKDSMIPIVGNPVWGKNCGTLPDGRLYWDVYLRIRRPKKNGVGDLYNQIYHFQLVYEHNHPQNQFGTSVHCYPVAPTDLSWMQDRANKAGRGRIPHIISDNQGVPYLCTADLNSFSATYGVGAVITAKASYLLLKRWLYTFEASLLDSYIWDEFAKHNNL